MSTFPDHALDVVNNAGIQFTAPVEEFPSTKWDAIPGINLSAAFHGIAVAVPQMKKQRRGRVVNIASAHGLVASTHSTGVFTSGHVFSAYVTGNIVLECTNAICRSSAEAVIVVRVTTPAVCAARKDQGPTARFAREIIQNRSLAHKIVRMAERVSVNPH